MKEKSRKKMITEAAMSVILFLVIVFALLKVCMYLGVIRNEPALPTALAITAGWSVWKVIKHFWDRRIEKPESEE